MRFFKERIKGEFMKSDPDPGCFSWVSSGPNFFFLEGRIRILPVVWRLLLLRKRRRDVMSQFGAILFLKGWAVCS